MAVLHTNNISTTLMGPILAGQTTIMVNSAAGMPSPTGGDYFTLTLDDQAGTVEILHCTARTANMLTVIRAREGTSDLNWPDLTLVELRLTAATIDSKISELLDDTTPELFANLDANGKEILDLLRLRTDLMCARTDTTNNIEFTNSRQTFKPFNSDVMNLTTAGMQLGAANARVTTIRDEDNMSSNSATSLCTQQSIKAYVDSFSQQRAKAWATFDSTAGMTILDSYNIASISNDGVGLVTVTLSTPMANANYVVVAMGEDITGADKPGMVAYREGVTPTTTSFGLVTARAGGDPRNMSRVSFVVFGDQ